MDALPEGYILVGIEIQSLYVGGGRYPDVVCVRRGERPVIDSPGNLYDGPRTWDIERKGDMGEIRMGLRTRSPERMLAWLQRRMPDDAMMRNGVAPSMIEEAIARRRED
jgi:hypothetical protein